MLRAQDIYAILEKDAYGIQSFVTESTIVVITLMSHHFVMVSIELT